MYFQFCDSSYYNNDRLSSHWNNDSLSIHVSENLENVGIVSHQAILNDLFVKYDTYTTICSDLIRLIHVFSHLTFLLLHQQWDAIIACEMMLWVKRIVWTAIKHKYKLNSQLKEFTTEDICDQLYFPLWPGLLPDYSFHSVTHFTNMV